jgi:hypothetical protein
MSFRLYFMPINGTGSPADTRTSAYAETELSTLLWTMMDMGNEPFCLVGTDITDSLHISLSGHADVIPVPLNLDQTLGAQLATVQSLLEAHNIPVGWVTSVNTYREILRVVMKLFQFLQRFQWFTPARLFSAGVTLDTQFNQLSVGFRTVLQNVAVSMNFDTSGLTGASTVRQILKNAADQWHETTVNFAGQVI